MHRCRSAGLCNIARPRSSRWREDLSRQTDRNLNIETHYNTRAEAAISALGARASTPRAQAPVVLRIDTAAEPFPRLPAIAFCVQAEHSRFTHVKPVSPWPLI